MEDGEQVQMIRINLALVAWQWGKFIHNFYCLATGPSQCD
jgi:hypothetical protein